MTRRAPAVSILASQGNGTLYIGVTSNLAPRIWLHRQGTAQGFARQSAMQVTRSCRTTGIVCGCMPGAQR